MGKLDLKEEIRRITNETAAIAAAKALDVAEVAKAKAAEVSTLAIAEALKAATLAATKATEAAAAAASIAASTSKDLEYIKKDIADTKIDIKDIKEKMDNKYVTKAEFSVLERELQEQIEYRVNIPTIGHVNNIDTKVDAIAGNITWAIRLVIGIIIVALMGLVIINSK